MNSDDITSLVAASASRFGFRDRQQVELLESRLRKAEQSEVLSGLVAVFCQGEPTQSNSDAQELAGRLLASLRPIGPLDLQATLRNALPRYDLSVEQFPVHLAALCGLAAVNSVLQALSQEPISEKERRALETMNFWLRNREHL
jgi:hypothetical protein